MNISVIRKLCLTLPEKPERKQRAVEHFASIGMEGVEFVRGVNADAFGLLTKFPYEVDNPGSGFNMGPHCVGIWLSHWMLWLALSLSKTEPHWLILEDDVIFHADWKARVDQAMRDVPKEFDWLFLGSCCTQGKGNAKIKGQIYDCRYPACFHAYVVSKKACEHLLATQRKCYAPIDLSVIFHSFRAMRVYTLIPRVADQFNTDISP